ncbi:MAG: MCE family protein [Deltaproteobacteria bacterium]|nr:MCE family protein [Deltaproteobacteria bacterium]
MSEPTQSAVVPPPPPPAEDRRRAVRVGLAFLVAVAVLLGLLIVTGPLAIVQGATVKVDFAYCGPIKPGAAVRLSGVVVGVVQAVELLLGADTAAGPDKMVRVVARIEPRAMAVLNDRSRFYVTTLGVLGEHYLDVEPAPGGTALKEGARVDGVTLARADLLLPRAAGLLGRADELLPSSPEALELLRATSSLVKQIDGLLGDPKTSAAAGELQAMAVALRKTLERLPGVLDHADALVGSLDPAAMAALVADARQTAARVQKTLDRLDQAPLLEPDKQEQLRRELSAALVAIDEAGRRADRLMAAVEGKEGAAGKLFWDEPAAADLKAVLKGLREDPVRFLLERRDPKRQE